MFRHQIAALIAATSLITSTASATSGDERNEGRAKPRKNQAWFSPHFGNVKSNEIFELLCGPQGPEVTKPPKPLPLPPLPNGTPNPSVNPAPNVVPEPSTYLLMATGLLGVAVIARRRRAPQA